MPRDREIAELIADVREHVMYLQELGVEDFRVEMPEVSATRVSAALESSGSLDARAVEPLSMPAKDAGIHPSFSKEGSVAASLTAETPASQEPPSAGR